MEFTGRGAKILVVDHERATLEMVQIRLDVAGYQAFGARTSHAALEVLGHSRFDAVILERQMPGIDGLGFLQAIASIQERRPMPVLLVGRNLAADDVRKAVGLGVRDVLAKPYSGAAIVERMQRMLKKAAATEPPAQNVVYVNA